MNSHISPLQDPIIAANEGPIFGVMSSKAVTIIVMIANATCYIRDNLTSGEPDSFRYLTFELQYIQS